jgi:hypothetical protein
MSIIDCTARTTPAVMLLNAMTRECKVNRLDILTKFNIPQVPLVNQCVKVCLTVNSVEVDFVKTSQEMWDRLVKGYDHAVLEKAKELISQPSFTDLAGAINNIITEAQARLEQELSAIMRDANAD